MTTFMARAAAMALGAGLAWGLAVPHASAGNRPAAIYVDSEAAAGGDGTEATPFSGLGQLQQAFEDWAQSNVTVYLAGAFRGQRINVQVGLTNVTIRDWPGKAPPLICGDVRLDGPFAEVVPGLHYTVPLNGADIVSIVEDWERRVDGQGRNYGHMIPVHSVAQVVSLAGSWFFDGNLLHLHASNDEDPNTSGREYGRCVSGSAWSFYNPVQLLIENVNFRLWVDPDNSKGYCIFMGSAMDCTIRNCVAHDYGFHGFGFVGLTCHGNTFDRCITRGGRDNGSSGYVFFANWQGITGCRAYDSEVHLYRLLDVNAMPFIGSQGWSANGFYCHSAPSALVADVELHRCTAYGYDNVDGFAFSGGSNMPIPADLFHPDHFGMVVYDSRIVNGTCNNVNPGCIMAFVRCDFDMTRLREQPPPSLAAFNLGLGNRVLFESCTIAVDGSGLLGSSCFKLHTGARAILQGCTIYDNGVGESTPRPIFRYAAGSAKVDANQTVFAHRELQWLSVSLPGVVLPLAQQKFKDCWYDNIRTDDGYSSDPLIDSISEFSKVMDPAGIYDLDPQFTSAPENLEGMAGGSLGTAVAWQPGVDRIGINLREYSGHFGAYQYGAPTGCPADLNADGQVNGSDLGLLLGGWGKALPGALGDINDDGVIGGLDLGTLLAAWGRCDEPAP